MPIGSLLSILVAFKKSARIFLYVLFICDLDRNQPVILLLL